MFDVNDVNTFCTAAEVMHFQPIMMSLPCIIIAPSSPSTLRSPYKPNPYHRMALQHGQSQGCLACGGHGDKGDQGLHEKQDGTRE